MHDEPGYWMSEGTQYHLLRVRDQLRLLATLAHRARARKALWACRPFRCSNGHIACNLAEQVDDVLGIWAPPGNALSSIQARRHVIEHASSHGQAT